MKKSKHKKVERIPTTEKLAKELYRAGAPMEMVQRARAGYYDDFKSHVADNIMLLITDLTKANLPQLIEKAMAGEFDAQDWEAEEWAKSAEGREVFKEFGL